MMINMTPKVIKLSLRSSCINHQYTCMKNPTALSDVYTGQEGKSAIN